MTTNYSLFVTNSRNLKPTTSHTIADIMLSSKQKQFRKLPIDT